MCDGRVFWQMSLKLDGTKQYFMLSSMSSFKDPAGYACMSYKNFFSIYIHMLQIPKCVELYYYKSQKGRPAVSQRPKLSSSSLWCFVVNTLTFLMYICYDVYCIYIQKKKRKLTNAVDILK